MPVPSGSFAHSALVLYRGFWNLFSMLGRIMGAKSEDSFKSVMRKKKSVDWPVFLRKVDALVCGVRETAPAHQMDDFKEVHARLRDLQLLVASQSQAGTGAGGDSSDSDVE